MLRVHAATLSLLLLSSPGIARAAGTEACPDGWFCDEGGPDGPAAESPPGAQPRGPNPRRPAAPPPSAPGPPIMLDAPPPAPAVPRRRRVHFREWGFNLHAEAALMGWRDERSDDAGMGGLGVALRYRPIPSLAFEAGLDFITGTDYQGFSRHEGAILANAIVFLNPRDLFQFYFLGGVGVSHADVTIEPRSGEPNFAEYDEDYYYAGGQAGLGLELRASHHFALNADLLGFIRGRTDRLSDRSPEFIEPGTGRTTNTSGGGLLRLGATLYW